ncbi:MAG TPA: shikimate dehydrogenase [Clostridia bacterium]
MFGINIDGMTSLYGLAGNHTGFSLIPGNFNTISGFIGYNSVMIPVNTEKCDIHMILDALRILNFKGVFVDTPHRCELEQILVSKTDEAQVCGAVNAVRIDENGFHGHNTEIAAFIKAFPVITGEQLAGRRIFLFGAGGIGKAIAMACAREHCESLAITSRTAQKAHDLSKAVNKHYGEISFAAELNDPDAIHSFYNAEIIIHATPNGMFPKIDVNPLPERFQPLPHHIVLDMIYNPPQTKLLQMAAEKGCRTYNGKDIMFFSSLSAFQWWTDVTVDEDAENKLFESWKELIYNI